MQYRAALIGCGNIGSLFADDPLAEGVRTHAGAYEACAYTTLVAVVDADMARATQCALRWGGPHIYTDIKKMLDEMAPQIVSICTPDLTHAQVLRLVIACPSVRAILVEKPVALDWVEARVLLELAQAKDIIVAVNYSRRYAEGFRKIAQDIHAGKLGQLQKISGFYTKGILHNGTHWLDLARWLVGEIKAVQGFNNQTQAFYEDPTLDAWLLFENGVSGFLQGLNAKDFSLFEMELVGSLGRMRLLASGHRVECFKVAASQYYTGYQTLELDQSIETDMQDVLLHAVNDLVHCLKHRMIPKCSGMEGLKALQIGQALIRSMQEQVKIEL